ncbi:unnamed protein product [Urochloa decumbens]|uniref:Uncharacterized protein n=1 Tax=Urochloa decumbens TaxID=240449 RepID=A0ABC9GB08_9POAL
MALRSLLTRIPVLQSASVHRIGRLQQLSPAAADRFLGTTCQGEQHILMTIVEKEAMVTKLQDGMKVLHQKTINDRQMLRKEMAEFDQEFRYPIADYSCLCINTNYNSLYLSAICCQPRDS